MELELTLLVIICSLRSWIFASKRLYSTHKETHSNVVRPIELEITNLTFLFKQNMVYVFHQRKEQSENKLEKHIFTNGGSK